MKLRELAKKFENGTSKSFNLKLILSTEAKVAREQVAELKTKLNKLESENLEATKVKDVAGDQRAKLQKLEAEIKSLNDQLTEEKKKTTNEQKTKSELEKKIILLQAEVQEASKSSSTIAENEELRKKNLENEIKDLKAKLEYVNNPIRLRIFIHCCVGH